MGVETSLYVNIIITQTCVCNKAYQEKFQEGSYVRKEN